MTNLERALAYAKQRGVDTLKMQSQLEAQDRTHLASLMLARGIPCTTKMKKGKMVELILFYDLIPHLTTPQRKRIAHTEDSYRTLRDRKARKLVAAIRRAGRNA